MLGEPLYMRLSHRAANQVSLTITVSGLLLLWLRATSAARFDPLVTRQLMTNSRPADLVSAVLDIFAPLAADLALIVVADALGHEVASDNRRRLRVVLLALAGIAVGFVTALVSNPGFEVMILLLGIFCSIALMVPMKPHLAGHMLAFLLGVVLLLYVIAPMINGEVWLAPETIETTSGAPLVGYGLRSDGGDLVVLEEDRRLVTRVPKDLVVRRSYCRLHPSIGAFVLGQQWFGEDDQVLPDCPGRP